MTFLKNYYRKPRPKEAPQNSKALFPKLPQSWSGNLSKIVPQSYSLALLPKAVAPKLRLYTPIGQSGSPKTLCKAIRELRPKITTESYSPKLLFFKIIIRENCSGKLAKIVFSQICSTELLPKAVPHFPKLFPKLPPQRDYPKAIILQTCSPKQFPKAILQSGSRKLLRKIAIAQNYILKLVPKAIPQS
jgi:hypothetical protein